MNKDSVHSDLTDKLSLSQPGKLLGNPTPILNMNYETANDKYQVINDLLNYKKVAKHKKAASVTSYQHITEPYTNKMKNTVLHQKPTYIILTIDGSGDKGSIKKKETPKASMQTLGTASYAKQGQSYQQLSSLKKINKKKSTHNRTKSDHVLQPKPTINFLSYKKSNASSSK